MYFLAQQMPQHWLFPAQLSSPPFSSAQPLLYTSRMGGKPQSHIFLKLQPHRPNSPSGPLASNHRLKMRRKCSHLLPGGESKRECRNIPPFPKTAFPLNLYNLDTFIPQVGVGHRAGELDSAPHLGQFCVGRASLLTAVSGEQATPLLTLSLVRSL